MNHKKLSLYSNNVYSQFGEDGIIEEILSRISSTHELNNWCVEFGAWDGLHFSNTCNLIKGKGYNAVLIEGDASRVVQLNKNLPQTNVHKICRFVNFEGSNTLDSILSTTSIPRDFDLLSIDIDGVDYYIFESIEKYKPKVICIEFNPSIPNSVAFVQAKDFSVKHGSSAKAFVELATKKGYSLVAATTCNLFFVSNEHKSSVISEQQILEVINPQSNNPQFLFVGYDGTILSNKDTINLPWHKVEIPLSQLQFLPKYLRTFTGDYNYLKKIAFLFYISFKIPSKFFEFIKNKFLKN